MIAVAKKFGVLIHELPPHLTHELQPLDCFFFRNLKQEIRKHKALEDYFKISNKWDIIHFLEEPLYHACCKRAIRLSFEFAGVWSPRFKEEAIYNKKVEL